MGCGNHGPMSWLAWYMRSQPAGGKFAWSQFDSMSWPNAGYKCKCIGLKPGIRRAQLKDSGTHRAAFDQTIHARLLHHNHRAVVLSPDILARLRFTNPLSI